MTVWLGPPKGLLARVRWCFLLTAYFNALLALLLIATSEAPPLLRILGALATAFLLLRWHRGYTHGRFALLGNVLAGASVLLVGFGAGDPMRGTMIVYTGLFLQAMFETRRGLAVATIIQILASAGAIVVSPDRERLSFISPEIILQPSGVALVAVVYVLARAIARHERAAARERALARVGSDLVACRTRETVYAAALEAVRAIVSPHAPADAILAFGDADRVTVIGTTSPNVTQLRGADIDLTSMPELRELMLTCTPYELDAAHIEQAATSLKLNWLYQRAFVVPLVSGDKLSGVLSVQTTTSLPEECKDGLTALGTEVALTLDNLALREQLAHQAFYDGLTGLANRTLFNDRLQHAVKRLGRHGTSLGVLLLDIDGFKTVNDSLGHAAGDRVLGDVAVRLRGCLRETDTPARLGGDEFAILLEDLRTEDAAATAEHLARRVLEALRAPIALTATEVFVSASVGIAIGSGQETVEELLSQADVAMYAAKRSGRSGFSVFEPTLRADVVRRLELETDLQRALEADQFRVHYQPIFDLHTQAPVSFEALVRWQHPRRGLIGPDQFVPLAEETGLIVPLGRWVLEQACYQMRRWRLSYPEHGSLSMHVNVAARQLREPTFVADVCAVLSRAEIAPWTLVLELTEYSLIQPSPNLLTALHELRRLGVRLALDDFGTGYSSLAYLRDLPFDCVKIDKSFVDGIEAGSSRAALIRAIVSLSSALRLRTVAEGVESQAQAALLRSLGCESAQGFFFAYPDEAHAFEDLLGAGAGDELAA